MAQPAAYLDKGFIDRFVAVSDADYGVRTPYAAVCEQADDFSSTQIWHLND